MLSSRDVLAQCRPTYRVRVAASIHIFQLIDFETTLLLLYSVTQKCFYFFSLFFSFLLSGTLRKCEQKLNREWNEWDGAKQLLCAEKQTSFLSTFVICVTLPIPTMIQCQGQMTRRTSFAVVSASGSASSTNDAPFTVKRDLLFTEIWNWNTKNSRSTENISTRLTNRSELKADGNSHKYEDASLFFWGGKLLSDKLHVSVEKFIKRFNEKSRENKTLL